MVSPFYKVNRIMKYFKKWTEGDISDIADKDRYKKILQTLEQLGDDELKILMLRYVKLAKYPEDRDILKIPTIAELAEAMHVEKSIANKLLSKSIYAFYNYYQSEETTGSIDQTPDTKRIIEETIEHIKSRIHFYKEWIEDCERSGLPKEHPNHRYFLRGLEKQEQWLVESKDKLKALLGGVECKN